MNKFIIFLALIVCQLSYSQNSKYISYLNWSDTNAFLLSQSPRITGYGPKSDSISKANNNKAYYLLNNVYYEINSWADYYNWYVQKYWYQWNSPDLYQYFYYVNDDFGMANYVVMNFIGKRYPAKIIPTVSGRIIKSNKKTTRYVSSDMEVQKLNKELARKSKYYSRNFNSENESDFASGTNYKNTGSSGSDVLESENYSLVNHIINNGRHKAFQDVSSSSEGLTPSQISKTINNNRNSSSSSDQSNSESSSQSSSSTLSKVE